MGGILNSNVNSALTERHRFYSWQSFITAQITGAATTLVTGIPSGAVPVTSALGMGKSSATWPIGGVYLRTTQSIGKLIPDLNDVDLTKPIYFDFLVFMLAGMSAADVISFSGTFLSHSPIGAAGAASDWGTDNAAVFTTAASSLTLAAADIENARYATGMVIPASTLTHQDYALTMKSTVTITTASNDEFHFLGTRMRFTGR